MALHPNPLSLKFLTGVVESRPDRKAWRSQYIGTKLLPMRDVGGYELTWDVVQSENKLAGIYAINGRPIPGSDILFEQRYAEVQNIMYSRVVHPTDVAYMREAGEIAVSRTGKALLQASQNKLRRLISECDDSVDATVEYMILRAMQGNIYWPPLDADGNPITDLQPEWGNVSIRIDYPLRAAFNQAVTTLTGYESRTGGGVVWSTTATSNPILDLEVIAHYMAMTIGMNAHNSTIVMSSEIMSYLSQNEEIISWLKGTERGTNFVAPADLMEYIKAKIGYQIMIYDAQWTYRSNEDAATGPTINAIPFLDRGNILIIPNGADLGYFAVAPSPDGKYKPGKYQWMGEDKEPPWETRVGEGLVGLPVPEHWDSMFVLDVLS